MIFAGSCNLRCSYCVIHKNPKIMNEYNNKIRESVLNGTFQKNLFNLFKDNRKNITDLSVWSGEPTINADIADKLLEPIFEYFENATEFMFSTNSLLGFEKGIKPYIDCLQKICTKHNRQITFILQFSLDGPEELNDKSRNFPGITKKVLKTMEDTARYAAVNCKDGFKLCITTKPTVSPENQQYLLENKKVFEWFKFFNDLTNYIKNIIKDNPNVDQGIAQAPTICTPYNYTHQDGILFRNFVREIKKLDLSKLENYTPYALFARFHYIYRDSIGKDNFDPGALLCSAGLNSVSVDYEGNLMTCHRIYDDWRLGGETFPKSAEMSQMMFNKKDIARVSYLSKTFFMGHSLKKSFFDAIMIAMVASGEIDKKYLKPEYLHLIYIMCGSQTCFAGECGMQTNSIYIPPMGLIRLSCNGALEEIIDYYERM